MGNLIFWPGGWLPKLPRISQLIRNSTRCQFLQTTVNTYNLSFVCVARKYRPACSDVWSVWRRLARSGGTLRQRRQPTPKTKRRINEDCEREIRIPDVRCPEDRLGTSLYSSPEPM